MRRDSVFVLLLATGLVLGGGHVARAAGAQSQADKQTQAVDQPAKTEQPQAAAAQAPPDAVQDQTGTAPDQTGDGKLTPVPGGKALGMSILGNQDAPKSLVIVPMDSPGIEKAKKIRKIGMHSSDTGLIYFDNVRVPQRNRIG